MKHKVKNIYFVGPSRAAARRSFNADFSRAAKENRRQER
jgi:hypothetical protein